MWSHAGDQIEGLGKFGVEGHQGSTIGEAKLR